MLCIPGQCRLPRVATLTIMKSEEIKLAAVLAWTLVWGVIAVSLVSSVSGWLTVVGSAALPPLMILRLWRPRGQAVPAPIREAHQ